VKKVVGIIGGALKAYYARRLWKTYSINDCILVSVYALCGIGAFVTGQVLKGMIFAVLVATLVVLPLVLRAKLRKLERRSEELKRKVNEMEVLLAMRKRAEESPEETAKLVARARNAPLN